MNLVIMIGNLTRDVTVTTLPTKEATIKGEFGLAVNREIRTGQDCDFFNCEVYGKIAEMHAKNIHKGSQVCVQGKMHLDRSKHQSSNRIQNANETEVTTKVYPKIIVEKIKYLDSKEE